MKKILTVCILISTIFINVLQVYSQDNSANAVYNAEKKLGIPHSGKIMDRMKKVETKLFGKSNENLSVQQRNNLIQNKLNPGSTKKTTVPSKTVTKTQTTKKATSSSKPKTVTIKKPIVKPTPKTAIKLKEDYEIVIPPRFDSASQFSEGLAAVTVGGKCGYIDKSGNFVINPQYDQCNEFSEGLAWVSNNDNLGAINKSGQMVIAQVFKGGLGGRYINGHVFYRFKEGLSAVKINNKVGFVDRTGRMAINPVFDDANSFSEGLAAVKINNKWGFIDKNGRMVISPQFDENYCVGGDIGYDFFNGTAWIGNNRYIDKNGKFINKRNGVDSLSCAEGLCMKYNPTNDQKFGFTDYDGNLVIDYKFHQPDFTEVPILFHDDVAVFSYSIYNRNNGKIINNVIDKKGNILITTENDLDNFSEGMGAIYINGKYGYIANPVKKDNQLSSQNNDYNYDSTTTNNNSSNYQYPQNNNMPLPPLNQPNLPPISNNPPQTQYIPPVISNMPQTNWTVDQARQEVFKNASMFKDLSQFLSYDPNYADNSYAFKSQQKRYKGRMILPQHDLNGNIFGYISRVPNDNITYYYNQSGQLMGLCFDIPNTKPEKSYQYKYPSGELYELDLYINDDEMFKFSPNGNLMGHWIKDKCYDAYGNIIASKQKTSNSNINVVGANNQNPQNNTFAQPPVNQNDFSSASSNPGQNSYSQPYNSPINNNQYQPSKNGKLTYEQAIKGGKPIVVKFYSDWCSTCIKEAPVFESVSKQLSKSANFVTINLDSNSPLINQFGVKKVPWIFMVNPSTGKKLRIPNDYIYDVGALKSYISSRLSSFRP